MQQAWAAVSRRVAELDLALTSIPSPTGEERQVAEFLASTCGQAGLDGIYQPIDDAAGQRRRPPARQGDGPDLLLYAPTDTAFAATRTRTCPGWARRSAPTCGRERFRRRLRDRPGRGEPEGVRHVRRGGRRGGARAGVPLNGALLVGLGAGGMPTNRRPGLAAPNAGQGNGCSFMLEQGVRGDFAILAKPGYAVAWEEVGLCWFRVRVQGRAQLHRHPPHRAVQEPHRGGGEGHPRPGGVVPASTPRATPPGWWRRRARSAPSRAAGPTSPHSCPRRLQPVRGRARQPAAPIRCEVKRELGEALAEIQAAHPGLELDCEMILSVPGTHTDPQNWIVQSLMRGWERREGRPHEPILQHQRRHRRGHLARPRHPDRAPGAAAHPAAADLPRLLDGRGDTQAMQR